VEAEIRACGFDHAALGYEICRRWHLADSVCEMVRTHHCYASSNARIPREVANLVLLVQEADCISFGLLRKPGNPSARDSDLRDRVQQSLRVLSPAERPVPAERVLDLLPEIEKEARNAAKLIGVAYS
jgi:hypothetical protein